MLYLGNLIAAYTCALSSVVERYIDIVKAVGSIPTGRTQTKVD